MTAKELPAEVVYYNRWTGFENKDVGALFEQVPYGDLIKLAPGSTIWIDSEQPSGKVYGFDRAEVIRATDHSEGVAIAFKGSATSGSLVVRKPTGKPEWHKVHRCIDDAKLLELIAQFPLAMETGTVTTISPASREYLRQQGARVVRT